MMPLHSMIENNIYPLYFLEDRLKPDGFIIASNWDYKEGHVELVIDEQGSYYIFRIPFYAVAGSLDYPGVTVRVEQPFLFTHHNRTGVKEEGSEFNTSQFHASLNLNANVSEPDIRTGQRIMKKVEGLLLPG